MLRNPSARASLERLIARACSASLALALLIGAVHAEKVDPTKITGVDVGPVTPYGETAAEASNKRIAFEWVHMAMIERQPQQAFEKYVSKDYCNHAHLSTYGQRDCANYDDTVAKWVRMFARPLKPGELIEYPTMATVDGEMVTMYGEGVDIFRVHNGKITDHWDASPPAAANIPAHNPAFVDFMGKRVRGEVSGEPPLGDAGSAAAAGKAP